MSPGIEDLGKERLGSTPAPPLEWELDPATRVEGLELDRWVIDFAWSKNPIPMNGQHGNPRAHARRVRYVRTISRRFADIAGIPPLGRCRVHLTWYVLDARRRDPVNLSYTLKALQDGLVDAGVVPDDTPDLMDTIMPAIVRVSPLRHRDAWMELTIDRWDGTPK